MGNEEKYSKKVDIMKDIESQKFNCYCGAIITITTDGSEARKNINELLAENKLLKDKIIEAIGWTFADCCSDLDKGNDPRKTNMPDVLERAKKDLSL